MNLPNMGRPDPLLSVCVCGTKCFEVSRLPSGMSSVLLVCLCECARVREYIFIFMLVSVIKTLI